MSRAQRNEQFVDAIADALLAAEEESDATMTECPECGEMLTVYIGEQRTDHMPPLCPGWARYIEDFQPPDESSEAA